MPNPVKITCNTIDISQSIDWTSVDLVTVLTKEVSTLKFNVKIGAGQTFPAKTVPKLNDVIAMYDSSGQIFGGTVTEIEATVEGLMLTYEINCTDWSYQLDGTLVVANYANMDPHDIVVAIVASFAGSKGFTTNHVQLGKFNVPSIKFNYVQVTKALEKLAKQIGWEWFVDPSKDIHFFPGDIGNAIGTGNVAPIIIDDTSGQVEWHTLDIDTNLQNMKNSVFVIGANKQTEFTALTTRDVYQTNGVNFTFPIAYKYSKDTITVTLDGVEQTIGIANQDDPSLFQVMYDSTNVNVQFTTTPGSGHTVKVYGTAPVPIVAHASDPVGIAEFGEFQDAIIDKQITTSQEALERAEADILQFGHAVYDVKVSTLIAGCQIGQTITLNSAKFGILNYALVIKRIETVVKAPGDNALGIDTTLEYQIEAIGSDNVTFVDIMATLLQQQNSNIEIADNTVLDAFVTLPESIATTDTLTVTGETRPYTWG